MNQEYKPQSGTRVPHINPPKGREQYLLHKQGLFTIMSTGTAFDDIWTISPALLRYTSPTRAGKPHGK